MKVTFIEVVGGEERVYGANSTLSAIPGTGDIIKDPGPGGFEFEVESVTHLNVFNVPGEHEAIVKIKKI